MDFHRLKTAVSAQFDKMSNHALFRVDIDKDLLWDTYLASFPEGTNPVFRKRTEHDCGCCRQFMRAVGDVVAIIDGKTVSIWDCDLEGEDAYGVVAGKMAALVKSKAIDHQFLHVEKTAGTDKNYESIDGEPKTWNHFFIKIPFGRNTGRNFYCVGKDIGPKLSESRALHDVFLGGLTSINVESVEVVLDLIKQNSIYRGEENRFVVTEFLKLKKEFDKVAEADRDNFAWENCNSVHASVAKIKNSSIGSLLLDLSDDRDLESAVKSFEVKVGATNFKRSTALVTKGMVEAAKAKIEELGYTSALNRRYATLADITINNIIFANRSTRKALTGDVFDMITTKKAAPKSDKMEEITIEKFISDVVPNVQEIELFIENHHANNMVSLIAPVDPTAALMFKWDNGFSWTYSGDTADSIKERVKKAGGNVTGDFCCRLAWHNHDDLDFHMKEPGYEIFYGNKGHLSPAGGALDVDMNVGHTLVRDAVENIVYKDLSRLKEGVYELIVHNFTKRETSDIGFEVEIDIQGTVHNFVYDKALADHEKITVVSFKYSKSKGLEILGGLPSTSTPRTFWNVRSQDFHKVNVLMMSPNYWDDKGVGNKHYFFMLEGCKNDESARGFLNEYLKAELNPHRKVLEQVGAKMRTEESNEQLSGLGFSSTKKDSFVVRVKGSFTRTLKVTI